MKYMVKLGKEPWKASFTALQANSYASYNYTPKWSLDSVRVVEAWSGNYNKLRDDVIAAYYNALQWYITGDARHAEKSVQIFNNMRNIRSIVTATQSLCAGRFAGKLIEAAEIIRSTYSGWKEEDINAFKAMLVYPGYSTRIDHSTDAEHSFYWAMFNGDFGRAGNQGLFGFHGTLAMAIFLDNEIMYDRIIRNMKGLKHRPDDLPYPSGPPIQGSLTSSNRYADVYNLKSPYKENTIEDYGYNEQIRYYIWENGQSQEASRDQVHSVLGVNLVNAICEIAWNQGDDLYSWLDYRPLLGFEYYFRYNLSYLYSFPDQVNSWEPTAASGEFIQGWDRSHRSFQKMNNPYQEGLNIDNDTYLTRGKVISEKDDYGGRAPIFEMTLAHYRDRMKLAPSKYKWLQRADSISKKLWGLEQFGNRSIAMLGYGGLTFHRTDSCPGDPVKFVNKVPVFRQNIAPCNLEAEDYDYFTSNGQNHTFFDKTLNPVSNNYRSDSLVTIKPLIDNNYKITNLENGEWLRYTVYIPEYAKYKVSLNYTSLNNKGKIKLLIGSQEKTNEISLPETGNNVWSDLVVLNDTLLSGIRSFKLLISGESNAFELNSIKIEKSNEPAKNDYVSIQSGDFNVSSNWRKSDGVGGFQSAIPTVPPATTNNVWIQQGHSMYASSSNVNARSLYVFGELVVGNGVNTPRNITLGSTATPGNLYVFKGGKLYSTTDSGSKTGIVNLYGNLVDNNGQVGSIDSSKVQNAGIKFLCFGPDKTTFQGDGVMNIASLQSGNSIISNQEIIIDANINILNTSTSQPAMSLLNGGAEKSIKTLTINEGKIVNFTGSNACLLHQISSSGAQSVSTGDFNYNIFGTLNTGKGGIYLTTSNLVSDINQCINLLVGPRGKLIVGEKMILAKPYDKQEINFIFENGSQVEFRSDLPPVFSSTSTNGKPTPFPDHFSCLILNNPVGYELKSNGFIDSLLMLKRGKLKLGNFDLTLTQNSEIAGITDTTYVITDGQGKLNMFVRKDSLCLFPIGINEKRYDPVAIRSFSDGRLSVRVDSVFNVNPKDAKLINPVEWTINSNLESRVIAGFSPSVLTNYSDPVIGYMTDFQWQELNANYDNKCFSTEIYPNGTFGTGSFSGFGSYSETTNQYLQRINYRIENDLLVLNSLDSEDWIKVYSVSGSLIKAFKSENKIEKVRLPQKGIYFMQIISNLNPQAEVIKIIY